MKKTRAALTEIEDVCSEMVTRQYEVDDRGAPAPTKNNNGAVVHKNHAGKFQYVGDQNTELGNPPLKAGVTGSFTDAIYRTESDSLPRWWRNKRRGWWSLIALAVLLLTGLVVYFLVTDMKTLAPIITKSSEGQPKMSGNDDVVALDGDVILDLHGVTYHEGEYHITKEPTTSPGENKTKMGQDDFIEIVPAPDLGAKHGPVHPTLPTSTRTASTTTLLPQPVNHSDSVAVGECLSPQLAMCRGVLPYDLTMLPLLPAGLDLEGILPYLELVLESGCSGRARQFVCSLLEPECRPVPLPPCRKACKAVAEDCKDFILQKLDLSKVFHCDRYPDSDDPSTCVNMAKGDTCLESEFHCPDGTCIPGRWRCDGTNDCPENPADEKGCRDCSAEEFRCQSNNMCIPKHWQCDGEVDCADSSDEKDCPASGCLFPGHIQCADKSTCIPALFICDGIMHCKDNTDEKNCSFSGCSPEDFQCGNTLQCISPDLRCDGVNDCADHSDEADCEIIEASSSQIGTAHTSPCPAGELRCLEGRCITLQQLCDGHRDCSDGADEVKCDSNV